MTGVDFTLTRPDLLDEDSWGAVEYHRRRLESMWYLNDQSAAIGSAEELVEAIASVILIATEQTIGANAAYGPRVTAAHKALDRQPGPNLNQSPELRSIAQSIRTMAAQLAMIRNELGTGHGRARIPSIDEELATVTVEAALLWARWALRRLGNLLAKYPTNLINAVHSGTSRNTLQRLFDEVTLPDQPAEVQHALGVAFGQESAGGFGNATEVGIDPAISDDLVRFPISYRLCSRRYGDR